MNEDTSQQREATVGDYGFLMFLTLINVFNVVDRQLLASMANWIKPELNLTNTQFGLLTGLIFIVFYAVAGVFMGVLAGMFLLGMFTRRCNTFRKISECGQSQCTRIIQIMASCR